MHFKVFSFSASKRISNAPLNFLGAKYYRTHVQTFTHFCWKVALFFLSLTIKLSGIFFLILLRKLFQTAFNYVQAFSVVKVARFLRPTIKLSRIFNYEMSMSVLIMTYNSPLLRATFMVGVKPTTFWSWIFCPNQGGTLCWFITCWYIFETLK